jgi:hypothetical protein
MADQGFKMQLLHKQDKDTSLFVDVFTSRER